MSHSFYTNVQVWGGKILYRGVDENGRKIRQRVDYHPTLFVNSQSSTGFTTIHGINVAEIKPGNIKDCRDFVEKYKEVNNFPIYGMQKYEYAFIADHYPNDIEWDFNHINVCNIDIEVGSENGFPEPATAYEPIIAITYKMGSKYIAYACGDFNNKREDVTYVNCRDEVDLIKRFIDDWSADYPDVITGWNVRFFDIPYIVNRMKKLFDKDFVNRFSPWNRVDSKNVVVMGKEKNVYALAGIAILDYQELYRKFAPSGNSQPSYKLNSISFVELGERKIEFEGGLYSLYKKDFQTFIEYNIRDVELVAKLDDKLKLIEMALTLAYDSKSNYDDVFTQVRMWDAIIFNHLRKKNMVIPPVTQHTKDSAYIGAYVKDPLIGKHDWVASFDLDSLYPHLIMQYNIGPETLIEPINWTESHRRISNQNISIDNFLEKKVGVSFLPALNCTMTPNGQFFRTDKQGFLAEIMESMYNDRKVYKKKYIEAKKEIETLSEDDPRRYELEKLAARYNNLQLAKKVSLNSAYGALGNEFFRFFDVRQASAITTAGQLSIRWIEHRLNEYMNRILKTENEDYVIASDTDSIYLSLDRLVNKTIIEQNPSTTTEQVIAFMDRICENKIQPFIDKSYAELAEYINAFAQKMRMKREALADKGIWTAKKRYILNVYNNEGVQYAHPKIKVMGLEMIKSSTPTACREKLWEAIDVVFNKDEDAMLDFIESFRQEFRSHSLDQIAFPRGVNGLQKFMGADGAIKDGCPIHVRGSLAYNAAIKKNNLDKKYESIKEGEKIKFIYLKEPNPLRSHVVSFLDELPKELDLDKYIDYNTQFDKAFIKPLKIILDSIGWRTERVSSLEDFFA